MQREEHRQGPALAAWVLLGVFAAVEGPTFVLRAQGIAEWSVAGFSTRGAALAAGALTVLVSVIVSSRRFGVRATRGRIVAGSAPAAFVAVATPAVMLVERCLADSPTSWRIPFSDYVAATLPIAMVALGLCVLAASAPRLPARQERVDAGGALVMASAFVLLGVLASTNSSLTYNCFGPLSTPQAAAASAMTHYGLRLVCELVATALLSRAFARAPSVPVAGAFVFVLSRAVTTAFGWVAAMEATDPSPAVPFVAALGEWADVVEFTGALMAVALIAFSTFGRHRPSRTVMRVAAPLGMLMLVSTSPAVLPHFIRESMREQPADRTTTPVHLVTVPMSSEARLPPPSSTRGPDVVATLGQDGSLSFVSHRASPYIDLTSMVAMPTDPERTTGVELFVDAAATFADLRRAASVLRQAAAIYLVVQTTNLHEVAPEARARWATVEMASRTLDTRELWLLRPEDGCHTPVTGQAAGRLLCLAELGGDAPATIVDVPEETTIREMLLARGDDRAPLAIVLPFWAFHTPERVVHLSPRSQPPDAALHRLAPRPPLLWGFGWGAALALLWGVLAAARALLSTRRLAAGARAIERAPDAQHDVIEVAPWWLPRESATHAVMTPSVGPYRSRDVLLVASPRRAMGTLFSLVTERARGAAVALGGALVVVVVVVAVATLAGS